jgi:protein-S-isoprenylcysteine O-methyltransferase Ste14
MNSITAFANTLIVALWIVWLVIWTSAAFFVKRTQRREPLRTLLLERVPLVAGILVLVRPHWLPPVMSRRLVAEAPGVALLALVLVVAGMVFAYWARAHLGRNWSGEVMVKVGHTLITSGPYRRVRHPIYSGMTLALVGTALATGAPYGFVALALILFGFLVRVQQEETLMRETFPGEYDHYTRRTARLIPGVY